MDLLVVVGCAAAVAVVLWRLTSARKRTDLPELHPLELGYLNGGAELAAIVACVGLQERGMLIRSTSSSAGLEMMLAEDRGRHPVEQAVAAAVAAGVGGRNLVTALRAAPAMVVVRDRLISEGLLTRRLGRHFCTRSGRTVLVAAFVTARASAAGGDTDSETPSVEADAAAGITGSGEGARRVAALGYDELSAVAPALARALGVFSRPRRVRWDAGTIVSRTIRRRATNNRRLAVGEATSDTTFSAGYYAGGFGDHGHLP